MQSIFTETKARAEVRFNHKCVDFLSSDTQTDKTEADAEFRTQRTTLLKDNTHFFLSILSVRKKVSVTLPMSEI